MPDSCPHRGTEKGSYQASKGGRREFKVAVRNIRRDAVDSLKKGEKNGDFSEDVQREGETEVQKVTDSNTKAIDELVAAKEKEIMTV